MVDWSSARGAGDERPSLIATDLDGTLLDASGEVSPRTRAALAAVWEAGIRTVFVTARPPRWLAPLRHAVDAHGVAICANGAFVYQVEDEAVLRATGIDRDVAVGIARDLRELLPEAGFAAERATGAHVDEQFVAQTVGARRRTTGRSVPGGRDRVGHEPQAGPDEGPASYERVAPIERVDGVIGKLLVRSPVLDAPEACEQVIARIAEVVGDRAQVAYSGAVGLAEIGPAGVTKASTLAQWCDLLGIAPEQVWAFGDMPNDLPMLAWAGRSFAVANAHESVRAAATDHAGHHDEDGVAAVLERLV